MKKTVLLYFHPIIALNEGYSKVTVNGKEYKFVASKILDSSESDETVIKVNKGKFTLNFFPTNVLEIEERTRTINGISFKFLDWKPEHVPSDRMYFKLPLLPLIGIKKKTMFKIFKIFNNNAGKFQFK